MRATVRLGRLFGIEVGVHYTWLFAFGLITWSLAQGFFPAYAPGWDQATYWATGFVAALLLFASVLAHELAHSVVARARGLPVRNITLFIFGGVSQIGGEAERPRDEFLIAAVGPFSSLVLAGLAGGLFLIVRGPRGPLEATLLYLALVNVLLAGFNLLPGFPLDGGRVLRSVLWSISKNMVRATAQAAMVGQVLSWGIIAYGVFQIMIQNSLLSGLWTVFIGWFLGSAAESSRRQAQLQRQFQGVPVGQVMELSPATIGPEASVEELVQECFLHGGRRAMPVSTDGRLLGIVTLTDVKKVSRTQWPQARVREIMTHPPLHTVQPADDFSTALRLLAEHGLNQLPVTQNDLLVGMLSRAEVISFLQFTQELGGWPGALTRGLLRPGPPAGPRRKEEP